jgi:hypothetical protein
MKSCRYGGDLDSTLRRCFQSRLQRPKIENPPDHQICKAHKNETAAREDIVHFSVHARVFSLIVPF